MSMGNEANKKFDWVMKNFSCLQSEWIYSDPVLVSGCKWSLCTHPKGIGCDYLFLYLNVSDFKSFPSGWRRYVKLRLTILNKLPCKSVRQESKHYFDAKYTSRGFLSTLSLSELHEKDGGFIENGEVMIVAELDVFESVVTFNASKKSEEASEHPSEISQNDGAESIDLAKKTLQVMERNVVSVTKHISTEKQVEKMFTWVLKNFSFSHSDKCYSDTFTIGGFKWNLLAEFDLVSLYLYLCVADCQSLPSEAVKFRLRIINQLSENLTILKDSEHCFDEQYPTSCITFPFKVLEEDGGFLVNEDLMIVAEVIGASDLFEDQIKLDVNGFHVLPSQVESVMRIFERHPDIAVEFRAKNKHLRTTFMNFLLSLIETMYQPLEGLSNEDLVEADIAVTYLEDVGFKVDWLAKKLNQLKEKKEIELSCNARVQEMEAQLHDLKHKFETEKSELMATRAALSFDDIV